MTAAAGYLVVGVFATGYLVASKLNGSDNTAAVVAGSLSAAPLALAFLWGRLKSVKAFGVEVSLEAVTIRVDESLANALTADQYFSGAPHLLTRISDAVRRPDLQLIEINLRSVPYWWSTRLYLQAALLDDFSSVERLVFVEDDGQRRYVGMATPRDVRRASGVQPPGLEATYRDIVDNLTIPPVQLIS